MSDEAPPSARQSPAANPMDIPCPNCGARLAAGWRHCIRCGLRYEPAAFARLAALDAERQALLARLLPSAPPIRAAQPSPVKRAAAPSDSGGAFAAWLLTALVYGGSLLMTVGAAIYFREVIWERPSLQMTLLAGVTAGLLGLGARAARRRPDDLAARGGLWMGALLLPLDFWVGVHYGWLPAHGGWAYALACGAAYWRLAAWVADRVLPYLAAPALLLAAWRLGRDLSTPAAALTLVAAAATALAVWSARHPGQVAAQAGRRWAMGVIAGCAVVAPSLDEAWAGGVAGAACLVLGRLVSARAAVWLWSVGGLAALTLSYGRWLAALELMPRWQAVGWSGWLWLATAAQWAAGRWETSREGRPDPPLAQFFRDLARVVAGALGLLALLVVARSAFDLPRTGQMPMTQAWPDWLALGLLLGWSVWHLRAGLTWFPLALATLSVLSLVGALACALPARPLRALALPAALCAIRLGVETLGVRFGQGYSTEVDTSFGLDFGLPNHPAIIPSRALTDACLLACLVGLLALAPGDWRMAHTLGIGVAAAYSGLCWLVSGVPRAQRAYALAMWSVAYLGLLNAGCGILGRADLFAVMPALALVAAAAAVGASRPVRDAPMLRQALWEVSLGALAVAALVALVEMLVSDGRPGRPALTLAAAAGAGWIVAWRQPMPLTALLATLCGGLAIIQSARLVGCPFEALPLLGIIYGYGAIWLGWRWPRRQAERALWSGLAVGGQCSLWSAALAGLMVIQLSDGLAAGGSLLAAAAALAMVGFLAAAAPAQDAYALGGLIWGGAAYAWWLRRLGLPALEPIAWTALPCGLTTGVVGWLKRRFRRGSPALAEALIWIGSAMFCLPGVLQALQRRLNGGVALAYDILADTAALAALGLGLVGRLRAPLALGGLALGLHLSAAIALSVPWGDIPYSVYLVATGLTLFLAGTYLWRRCG